MSAKVLGMIALNAFLLVVGQVFWKGATVSCGLQWWRLLLNPSVWLGFGCFGLATVIWFYVLSRVPLSQALPVQSITYVLGVLAGILLFREKVSVLCWIGTLLIMAGVFMVAGS